MRSLGLLLLRLIFGSLIALHGLPKLFGGEGKKVSAEVERVLGAAFNQSLERGGLDKSKAMMERMELPMPDTMAALSAGTEFFGGLAVMLGWHTRLAALLLMGNMGVAIRKVHWEQGIMGERGAEKPLLFLGAFLTLFIAGPGAISLDRG
ncbi:MAG TPA: DoxX family protein [Thermomicrobiales bacterium]|nr:DoxX family protein [Thermomicrobiales bacterium]